MATKNEKERLAVVEEKVDRMRDDLCVHIDKQDKFEGRIEAKLDRAIENKADKSEVEDMRSKLWWIITTVAGSFVAVLLYIIQDAIKK